MPDPNNPTNPINPSSFQATPGSFSTSPDQTPVTFTSDSSTPPPPVIPEAVNTVVPNQPLVSAPPSVSSVVVSEQAPNKKVGSKSFLVIILILIVAGLAVGGYFYFNQNQVGGDKEEELLNYTEEEASAALPPVPTERCNNIKVYDPSWNLLLANQMTSLKEGDQIYLAVSGISATGTIDKAKFIVNGVERSEVIQKKPGSEEFYDVYTIPTGTRAFTINAKLHHTSLGWF